MSTTGQPTPLLEMRGVSKTFPGVKALQDVSIQLLPNEVLGLCGENGAGKSTLMKILSGVYHADEGGELYLRGERFTPTAPREAMESGVAIIHQELNLVPDATVAENIFLGREFKKFGVVTDNRRMEAEAEALLKRLGIDLNPRAYVRELSVARQQMVEIAKALSQNCQILVMDEPTAALTESETATLFELIRDFLSEETAIIYISHRMEEIALLTNRVTVLRDGKYVDTFVTAETDIDTVIAAMVGRELVSDKRPAEKDFGSTIPALRVQGLSTANLLKDINLEVRPGEILGVAGLMGAGRTELARAIVGADKRSSGTIYRDEEQVNIHSPADAVKAGICYLSEDRKQFGLMLDMGVDHNAAISSLESTFSTAGAINDKAAQAKAQEMCQALSVKTPSVSQRIRLLSGGNQQKVIIARWLLKDCDVLIFDEPTRGIDIGAKEEIYGLLEALCVEGKAVLVISSEIPELLRICDRIAVMCDGRITGELENREATPEKIMTFATAFEERKAI